MRDNKPDGVPMVPVSLVLAILSTFNSLSNGVTKIMANTEQTVALGQELLASLDKVASEQSALVAARDAAVTERDAAQAQAADATAQVAALVEQVAALQAQIDSAVTGTPDAVAAIVEQGAAKAKAIDDMVPDQA